MSWLAWVFFALSWIAVASAWYALWLARRTLEETKWLIDQSLIEIDRVNIKVSDALKPSRLYEPPVP